MPDHHVLTRVSLWVQGLGSCMMTVQSRPRLWTAAFGNRALRARNEGREKDLKAHKATKSARFKGVGHGMVEVVGGILDL